MNTFLISKFFSLCFKGTDHLILLHIFYLYDFKYKFVHILMLLLFELHYIFQTQVKNLPFSHWDMSIHWILVEW